jgi:hypothetical protein
MADAGDSRPRPASSALSRLPIPRAMSSVAGAQGLSMASLYALMGLAMPPAASGDAAATPALAVLSATNDATAVEVQSLLGAAGGTSSSTPPSLTSALLGLATLDPTLELERLESGISPSGA